MTIKKPLLLIPVENQIRELDPKLLLACVAAERGFSSVIGSGKWNLILMHFREAFTFQKA